MGKVYRFGAVHATMRRQFFLREAYTMDSDGQHLESRQPAAEGSGGSDPLSTICAGLRGTAYAAVSKLSQASPKRFPGTVRKLLNGIVRRIDANAAHLFLVKLENEDSGRVGMKFNSGEMLDAAARSTLQRFQFRLFSSPVREALIADQIASVSAESSAGGRIVNGLIRLTKCKSYLLCPIVERSQLKGILGIAWNHSVEDFTPEFFELLRLNGAILLNNVLRTRRERDRRRKLRQWRKIADQACDFAISVDSRLQICRTTGFGAGVTTPELTGLRLIDVVTRNFHSEVERQIEKAVTSGRVRTCDFQVSLDHEGPRWFLARIEPASRQENLHATLYLTDNNPDKVMEEEIRVLTDQLLKASRLSLLGQMSTEYSHQLKQPLQAMLNYCNMLQRRIQRGTFSESDNMTILNKIESSIAHSAEIIESIRDFVRFRSLTTESVALQDLIEQAVAMVTPTARGWNADLICPVDVVDVFVNVDKAQTTHVLVNLIINAMEACRDFGMDRPRIELILGDVNEGRVVSVFVKDNGPGIPKDDEDIVFRKFYSSKKEGLGMGLAISRDVCESQGGSLTATNNSPASGCTFRLTLPRTLTEGSDTEEFQAISDVELCED